MTKKNINFVSKTKQNINFVEKKTDPHVKMNFNTKRKQRNEKQTIRMQLN